MDKLKYLTVYGYALFTLVVGAVVFGWAGPYLISAKNDLFVIAGMFLVAITFPVIVWSGFKFRDSLIEVMKKEDESNA